MRIKGNAEVSDSISFGDNSILEVNNSVWFVYISNWKRKKLRINDGERVEIIVKILSDKK
jgi:hypothetical protein